MSRVSQPALSRSDILRKRPTQERSRKTFDTILAAAAELLIEQGWDGFNTNLLAERAGCRVATLYRYFPDKLAVLCTLAELVVSDWDAEFAKIASATEADRDLRETWLEFSGRFLAILQSNPAALAVRKAMNAVPELRAIDQEDNRRLAEHLAAILCTQLPSIPKDRALSAARVLIESEVALIDLSMAETEPAASCLLDDLQAMHLAYFDRLYSTYQNPLGG